MSAERFQRVVTTLRIILVLCRGASILFAVVSVYYWFGASTVTVTDSDKRYDPRFDFVVNDPDHKADKHQFFRNGEGAEQVQQDCCNLYSACCFM